MTSTSNHGNNNLPASPKTGGKYIEWVDGRPMPRYAQPLNKQQMSELVTAALSTEYEGDIDPETGEPCNFDSRYRGMTKAEVMALRLADRAAAGDNKATTEVLDRVLGKPKQSVETVGVKMTYHDFLEMLEKDETAQQKAEFTHTIDLEAVFPDDHTDTDGDDEDDDWI